jgi:hypothetical protein
VKNRALRTLLDRIHAEQGMAIVVAMVISMIVVTLGAASVSLAIHNSQASAYDRNRVQSIHAAEAGINYYFSHLQSGGTDDFQCTISQTLNTTPVARFDATVVFYDAAGFPLACPLGDVLPDSALIRSVGRTTSDAARRTMEARVNLVPLPGGPFGEYAIFSDGPPGFDSNVVVFGGDGVEGNVYSNSDILVRSNSIIHGNIDGQGSVRLESTAEVNRSIHAASFVELDSDARVLENVTSAGSSIRLDGNAQIFGDARAATTITVQSSAMIHEQVMPNSPSSPPPFQPFPELVFDPFAWGEAGYTVHTFLSCLDAKAFIAGIASGDHVVRITSACDLAYSSNQQVTVRGNLAIVSNGSLSMGSNTFFANEGEEHTLHLLFGLGRMSPCDIRFDSNSEIDLGLRTVLYTPCAIDMRSNTLVVRGQMFGGSVLFNSNTQLTYEPIGVPGFGETSFEEDVVFVREVANS